MDKILAQIDKLIEKIPIHFRDLIQKAFFMLIALAALIAIIMGIQKGIENATPGGAKIFQKNEDFFYIDKLKEENKKKNRLIEDVEVYKDLFESRDERLHPTFRVLGKDTADRLIGEKEEFIKKPDSLRKKEDNFLIDEDKEMEYEKKVPDDLMQKEESQELPFIETGKGEDERNRGNIPEPVMEEHQKETVRSDKTKAKKDALDFID